MRCLSLTETKTFLITALFCGVRRFSNTSIWNTRVKENGYISLYIVVLHTQSTTVKCCFSDADAQMSEFPILIFSGFGTKNVMHSKLKMIDWNKKINLLYSNSYTRRETFYYIFDLSSSWMCIPFHHWIA